MMAPLDATQPDSPYEDAARAENVHEATQQASTTIEVGDDSVSDSGLSDDARTNDSASLSSSIRDHAFENGRRYHRYQEGKYAFPNDDQEQDREDMKHALVVTVMGDHLYFSPIGKDPHNILDLGTGTGIWAVEMGEMHPGASVIGIDLSPIQPHWVPPNVKFMVDDAEASWTYPENHFDLVHARNIAPAIKNWEGVFQQAHRHIKPGGWIELQDFDYTWQCDDDSIPEKYRVQELVDLAAEGLKKMNVDMRGNVERFKSQIAEAGFVNVEERVFKVPLGSWPKNKMLKKVGLYMMANTLDGLQAIALGPMCRGLGWTKEEVEVFLAGVREHLKDPKIHAYMNFRVFYGQKSG